MENWTEKFDKQFIEIDEDGKEWMTISSHSRDLIKEHRDFISELLEEERNKWQLKNAGLYRQLFGESGVYHSKKTFNSKELWEIFNDYAPLFTPEQLEDIKKTLK